MGQHKGQHKKGLYGDARRTAAMKLAEDAMVDLASTVIHKLGHNRCGEMRIHRALSSNGVTAEAVVKDFSERTARAGVGRRIVVAQDTTEVNFSTQPHKRRALGAGANGTTPGFFIHAAVAVDVDEEAVLGLVDATLWTRKKGSIVKDRHQRPIEDKESLRWITTAQKAAAVMHEAKECIIVGDRESDIYELFARKPEGAQLIVRSRCDRAVTGEEGARLHDAAQNEPELGRQEVVVASRGIGDKGRKAVVAVRAKRVMINRPANSLSRDDAGSVSLTVVEAREVDPPGSVKTPLFWRLLTTLDALDFEAAAEVVRLYRLRWRIEQSFRMLKSDGLKLEETQTEDRHRLFNLAALAMGCAVKIIQLVDARDGSARPATDVASDQEIKAAKALLPRLEGKTDRQKNPHEAGSLAWLSWVVARLGGWNCYYKPPGPKTMSNGWLRFAAIADGFALAGASLYV